MAMTYQVFLYDSFPLILQTFILYSVKNDSLVFDGLYFIKNLQIHMILRTTQNVAANVLSIS